MFTSTTNSERVPPVDPFRAYMETLELAGKNVDKYLMMDNSFPTLINRMRITPQSGITVSGLNENDYPSFKMSGLANIKQLSSLKKVPLPPEIMEHFGHMQCSCMMGIFPEINRAWLTIDSDIYIWNFENGSDVAYYDGLSETIISVGIVKPKPGVFQSFVRHLLVVTTAAEIIVLGITLTSSNENSRIYNELHLTQEIIYTLTTDGISITVVAGTDNGRIFLGGKDGSLFEIIYQVGLGWWGNRCKKVNHSTRSLSFLVPSFISAALHEEDSIIQISVDNSRHILYTLTEKGSIEVFDLGENGTSISRIVCLSQSAIVQSAMNCGRIPESKYFRPVISINAIEIWESADLGVVAVTEHGVRLYFTTGTAGMRPTTLHLAHIRMPPGFAASPSSFRPNAVNIALYTSGNLLLVTSPGANKDHIWCLSGDIFPMQPIISEHHSHLNLEGVVWAMKELKPGIPPSLPPCEQPPLLVRQHYEPVKKFVLLTPQGAEILKNLRPVDVLNQLFCANHGPESEAVECYFQNQTEDQACATCLMLACDQNTQNVKLAEWATRAFFLYGGDPKVGVAPMHHNVPFQSFSLPTGFNPCSVSTPVDNRSYYFPPDNTTILYSAKHNGLYLYISRILRPIWHKNIVQQVVMDNKKYLVSSVVGDEVSMVAGLLLALRTFLEKNTQISSGATPLYCDPMGTPPTGVQPQRSRLQEAQLQERKSLDALKALVDHSYQVLGLWKILCEHQFHVITDTLSLDQQNRMIDTKFGDLILVGQDLCTSLINNLINTYLNDNASINPISLKLRDVCPKLYRSEDATVTKANEMINFAKTKTSIEEKDKWLQAALNLYKEVAVRIISTFVTPTSTLFSQVCHQFVLCEFYEGVVELCVLCAAKCDPKDLALTFLTKQPLEEGKGAYEQRRECYEEVIKVLNHLYHQSQANPYSPRIPISPGVQTSQSLTLSNSMDYVNKRDQVITLCMATSDQLLHFAIYDWMKNKQLYAELIEIAKPSFELYIKQASTHDNRSASEVADLLWKYHALQGNHAAAAQILYTLAKEKSSTLQLSDRITYLAKAVMCMRSNQMGCAPGLSNFLNDLEDLLQVANVQKEVLDAILKLPAYNERAKEAEVELNGRLMNITELYESFADPFDLWECKLSIFECSGHDDEGLIHDTWRNIIDQELRKCTSSPSDDKILVVLRKVEELGKKFSYASRCFPIDLLVTDLELKCCQLNASCHLVHSSFLNIGVSVTRLLSIYKILFAKNDSSLLSETNGFYLIQTIKSLAESFINKPALVNLEKRNSVAVMLQDLITSCLNILYCHPNTEVLSKHLKTIQTKLESFEKLSNGN